MNYLTYLLFILQGKHKEDYHREHPFERWGWAKFDAKQVVWITKLPAGKPA